MPNYQTVVKTELLTATVNNGALVQVIVHSQTPGDKSFATLTEKVAHDIQKMSEALTAFHRQIVVLLHAIQVDVEEEMIVRGAVQSLGRAKVWAMSDDDRCHCGGVGCNSCEPQGRG